MLLTFRLFGERKVAVESQKIQLQTTNETHRQTDISKDFLACLILDIQRQKLVKMAALSRFLRRRFLALRRWAVSVDLCEHCTEKRKRHKFIYSDSRCVTVLYCNILFPRGRVLIFIYLSIQLPKQRDFICPSRSKNTLYYIFFYLLLVLWILIIMIIILANLCLKVWGCVSVTSVIYLWFKKENLSCDAAKSSYLSFPLNLTLLFSRELSGTFIVLVLLLLHCQPVSLTVYSREAERSKRLAARRSPVPFPPPNNLHTSGDEMELCLRRFWKHSSWFFGTNVVFIWETFKPVQVKCLGNSGNLFFFTFPDKCDSQSVFHEFCSWEQRLSSMF